MPTDKFWLIPVLLDDSSVPSRQISAGEELADLQYVSLHDRWSAGVGRIADAILASSRPDQGRTDDSPPALREHSPRPTAQGHTPYHPEGTIRVRTGAAFSDLDVANEPAIALVALPTPSVRLENLFSAQGAEWQLLSQPPTIRGRRGFGLYGGRNVAIKDRRLQVVSPRRHGAFVWPDGMVVATAAGDESFLCSHGEDSTNLIHPLRLVEFTYLFVELAKGILAEASPSPTMIDWYFLARRLGSDSHPSRLPSGPSVELFRMEHSARSLRGTDFSIHTEPLAYDTPQGVVAHKMLEDVYITYGHPRESIPYVAAGEGGSPGIDPALWADY